MWSERKTLRPILLAGWAAIAIIAIWQTREGLDDAQAALVATGLLLAGLAASRIIFRLPLTSAPMMYLVLLGLFHLGLVAPWALGLYDINRAPWFRPYGLSRALDLVIYAIAAYQLGIASGAVAVRKSDERHSNSTESTGSTASATDSLEVFVTGTVLLVCGAAMFVFGLIGLDPIGYLRLTYSEIFRLKAESDPRLFGSGITIGLIGLSIASAGASKRQLRILTIFASAWLLSLMFWGFRGPALIAAVVVWAVAIKKGVRPPVWTTWTAVALLLVLLPVIRIAREQPAYERLSQISVSDVNVLDAPAEMGASLRPLVETADLIGPGQYRHGRTYWLGIKGIIPNLAIRWESQDSGSPEDLPPSSWITSLVDPWAYNNQGGMGFSAVAEPYMNFGTAGVVAYFWLLGVLLVKLEEFSPRNAYSLASWSLIVGPLLWTTRNDFVNFFRPAIWGLLCLCAIWVFSGAVRMVRRSRTERGAWATSTG